MADPQIAPSGAHEGWEVIDEKAPASDAPSAGTWEKRGMAGDVWHPAGATGSKAIDPELGRVDNSALGLPPEMAALSALAIARAAALPAANLIGRAKAAMAAAGVQAAPALKYEVTKTALQAIGIPAPIAVGTALMVSGYRKGGGKIAPTAAAETPLPEGVDHYMPNASATPSGFAPSAAGVAGSPVDRYMPNVSPPPMPAQPSTAPSPAGPIASPAAALAARLGTPSDIDLVKALIAKGNSAAAAVKTISRGDPKKFGALMTAYMQSRQVK